MRVSAAAELTQRSGRTTVTSAATAREVGAISGFRCVRHPQQGRLCVAEHLCAMLTRLRKRGTPALITPKWLASHMAVPLAVFSLFMCSARTDCGARKARARLRQRGLAGTAAPPAATLRPWQCREIAAAGQQRSSRCFTAQANAVHASQGHASMNHLYEIARVDLHGALLLAHAVSGARGLAVVGVRRAHGLHTWRGIV